ncbi:hypothetical protein BSKO_08573 [Bryopsis sp. KO-2023]|nr:hypothetical protein BSKO_08573 [Bryopsis sp. KO-2023]
MLRRGKSEGSVRCQVPPRDKSLDALVELGYERVETGPTTNFVGNHMTQAAIDLVQADLEDLDEEFDAPEHRILPVAPKLLQTETRSNDQLAVTAKPIHKYTWSDEGEVIRLRVGMGVPLGSVECCFRSESMRLVLVDRQNASHELHLKKLWSRIREDECTWEIKGDKVVLFLVKEDGMAAWDCLVGRREETEVQRSARDEVRFSNLRKSLIRRKRAAGHGENVETWENNENKASTMEAQGAKKDARTVPELKSAGDNAYLCGNYGEAVICFESSLNNAGEERCDDEFEECKGEIIQRLAECCWKMGNRSKAIRYCKDIIQDPNSSREVNAEALVLTAKVEEENENFQEALKSYELANRLTPGLRMILDGIGRNKQMVKVFGLEID